MNRALKFLCLINILLAAGWLSILTSQTSNDDTLGIDKIFWAAFFIRFLYALQGLLLFPKPLKKWDLISSGIVLMAAAYFAATLGTIDFIFLAIPMIIYGCLQLIRNKIPDNLKIAYLNIWNILLVVMSMLDSFAFSI